MSPWERDVLDSIRRRDAKELKSALAGAGRWKGARELLDGWAGENGELPLPEALDSGWEEGALLLLAAGANPNWVDRPKGARREREGRAPLALALSAGLLEAGKRMLSASPAPALPALAGKDWAWALMRREKSAGFAAALGEARDLGASGRDCGFPLDWGALPEIERLAEAWGKAEPETIGALQDWLLEGVAAAREKIGSEPIPASLKERERDLLALSFGAGAMATALGEREWPEGELPAQTAKLLIDCGEGRRAAALLSDSLFAGRGIAARRIEADLRGSGNGKAAMRAIIGEKREDFGEIRPEAFRLQREIAASVISWCGEELSAKKAAQALLCGLPGCALEMARARGEGWEGVFGVILGGLSKGADGARELAASLRSLEAELGAEDPGQNALRLERWASQGKDPGFWARAQAKAIERETSEAPGSAKGKRSL